jgi:hypothetical protein
MITAARNPPAPALRLINAPVLPAAGTASFTQDSSVEIRCSWLRTIFIGSVLQPHLDETIRFRVSREPDERPGRRRGKALHSPERV